MKARFTLRNDMSETAELAERVLRLGKDRGLPDEVMADVRLALEEVLSNIVRHGYGGQRGREIRVRVALEPDAITLEVQDEGTPFNPLEHPGPDRDGPAEARGVGGHGILLVRRLMDEVAYRLEGGRNVLVLTKRIRRPAGGGGGRGRT